LGEKIVLQMAQMVKNQIYSHCSVMAFSGQIS
jgi:hypothetical protein